MTSSENSEKETLPKDLSDVADGRCLKDMCGYIDVHCHLTGDEYGDISALIERLEEVGVRKVITAGFDIPSSQAGMYLAEKYPSVYFTAGFHPTELKKYREGDLDIIKSLLSHPKCVALGEIGLDYHYEDTDKPLQHKFFAAQLEMAAQAGLPVEIHSRDCAEDMYNFVKERAELLQNGALLHCYSHSAELALQFLKLGFYFSFGGTSTYKGSKRARKSMLALPVASLLTETDSPYLPPASLYGTFPNTPASIPEITASMAAVKELDENVMKAAVWKNAHTFFKKLNG